MLRTGHLITSDADDLYVQRKDKVYRYHHDDNLLLFSLKLPIWKRLCIRLRLCERLFRTEIRAASIFENKLFYVVSGRLYSFHLQNRVSKCELIFRKGMKSPLGLTNVMGIEGFDDQICFGEYFSNKERESIHIWSYMNGKWKVAYTFPQGTIRHIHGIVADKYRNCLYILTGDRDSESVIWIAHDNFKSVKKLIWGNQQSRCCVLQPRKDCLVYATDSEYEKNGIYKVWVDKNGKIKREQLFSLDASVIHGYISDENNLYFSTTVEPDKGGICTNQATVFKLDQDYKLYELITDEKDKYSAKFFQYGYAVMLKNGNGLYVNYTATKKYDGIIVKLGDKND
ncbi:MAG: hypothetical protein PUB46_10175 [Lachnospiraceae bacterium]|nr:hypothetical protein [Lachnospiraceae bacterium]